MEAEVGRRRFDHLVQEISVAVGALIPRYALWLRLHELGADPECLLAEEAVAFCEGPLLPFLAEHGHWLAPRALRGLIGSVDRYDPSQRSPEDFFSPDTEPG
jgi:hypothetical protein